MKALFAAATVLAAMALPVAAQQAGPQTPAVQAPAVSECEADNQTRTFKLTFDAATNKGIFEGKLSLPSPVMGVTFDPDTHRVEDPNYQDFYLTVLKGPDVGTAGITLVDIDVRKEFAMGTKDFVQVFLQGAETSGIKRIICPVPGRAKLEAPPQPEAPK